MSAIKNMSLFIPHVFPNYSKEYVSEAFANYGEIDHIDFVAKNDRAGSEYNAVYIHFKKWYNTPTNVEFQNRKINHVYHENNWYWIVLPNTANKHISGNRKPRIDLGESKSISVNTPVKSNVKLVCPDAPKKSTYAEKVVDKPIPNKLNTEFEEFDVEASEEEAQMAELEDLMDAEEQHFVTIDGRYVETLEHENMWLRCEIGQLRQALINLDQMYQAEAAKVRSFQLEGK
jgi:hypothetical protein